jgi:hypothetical protein
LKTQLICYPVNRLKVQILNIYNSSFEGNIRHKKEYGMKRKHKNAKPRIKYSQLSVFPWSIYGIPELYECCKLTKPVIS